MFKNPLPLAVALIALLLFAETTRAAGNPKISLTTPAGHLPLGCDPNLARWEKNNLSPSVLSLFFKSQQTEEFRRGKEEFRERYFDMNPEALASGTPEGKYRDLYLEFLPKLGLNGMLDVMEEEFCHPQGHDLGMIVQSKTKDLTTSLRVCGERCTSSCMHGVFMEVFSTKGRHSTLEDVRKTVGTICDSAETGSSVGNCVHGVGHGAMLSSGYDVPAALELCKTFPTRPMQYYCVQGAYMQYYMASGDQDTDKFHYPCDSEKEFPSACYMYKLEETMPAMISRGKEMGDFAGECMSLRGLSRLGCFFGIGRYFYRDIRGNPDKLGEICSFGTDNDQRMCIEGAIDTLSFYHKSQALKACRSLQKFGDICATALKRKRGAIDMDFSLYFKPAS